MPPEPDNAARRSDLTIDAALRTARARLAAASATPDLDARRLLEHVTQREATELIAHGANPLERRARERFEALLTRRTAGEPIAYLTGQVGFWTLALAITPDVLVPRPDTETLVAAVLEGYDEQPLRVLDLGTGSGAIALALASERPRWQITATDASATALACAQANAVRLGLNNVAFRTGRWYAPVAGQRFDLVVSNPPYVASGDAHLDAPALQHEPQMALVADRCGLGALEHIIAAAAAHLSQWAALYLEHGATQGAAVRTRMAAAAFDRIATVSDLGGNPRVSHGRLKWIAA